MMATRIFKTIVRNNLKFKKEIVKIQARKDDIIISSENSEIIVPIEEIKAVLNI